MLDRCSTAWAPWFVIPADRKWARNAAIAAIVRATLEDMDPRYPKPALGPEELRHRLMRPRTHAADTASRVASWPKIHSRGSGGGAGIFRLFWNCSRACSTTREARGRRSAS